jgi:hypothetical protein
MLLDRSISARTSSADTVTHGRPIIRSCRRRSRRTTRRPPREFPTAGAPAARARARSRSRSCRFTSSTALPSYRGSSKGDAAQIRPAHAPSSSNRWRSSPSKRHRPQVARRDDPVGVDVVAAQRQRAVPAIAGDVAGAHRGSSRDQSRARPPPRRRWRPRPPWPAHEQRAPGGAALAALEVPVRRGGAHLPPLELVGVHAEAHRAARARHSNPAAEHLVQPLGLGRPPHD